MVLGDAQIPPIHTILIVDGGRVLVEALTQSPLLKVNGNVVGTAILEDNDELSIGGFQFVVHLNHEAIAQTLEVFPDVNADVVTLEDQAAIDPTELSAAELVELIEAEQSQIDRFERQLQTGQAALLRAAVDRNTRREGTDEIIEPVSAPHHTFHTSHALPGPNRRRTVKTDERFVDEFERVRMELEDFSLDLEQRLEKVNHREDNLDAAAKELADAQNKLVAQLGTLLEQIAAQQNETEPRAIA